MDRPSRRPFLANTGLVLASLVFFFVAAELFLRAFLGDASLWHYPNYIVEAFAPDADHVAQMRYDPLLGYAPSPGYKGTLVGRPISYDAYGLRQHNLDRPVPAGRPILAVGDSFTEGYLAANDETWTAHLQHLAGRPVLNGGVRSYGIGQIVLRAERLMREFAPELAPDTIVLGFIPDDIDRTELDRRDNHPKPYFALSDRDPDGLTLLNVPVPRQPPTVTPLRRVIGYSYFLHYFMMRLQRYELWFGMTHHVHHSGSEVSCRLMQRFARLVRERNVKALVVAFYEDTPWLYPGLRDGQQAQVAYVLGCAAKAGLATLDTWNGFSAAGMPAKAQAFYYGNHFTDAGAQAAARLIAAQIAR